ncbi:hypothetical protein U879_02370 [Defluviimonas sp. 20V17]|uniref:Uncharacterized protein n=1 Tax=Allgaiera indica TaxID=765699 RepID=A0AAN5A160_9RHOB|nr:hypothetical protein [Allgaiera indica]KDB05278.1 hypothetical protein U879_02370 [Defluviimonas sp. 20V17]GHE04916.1 hypothetical protein GCM10008024_33890 [Allgaiera indica]SDX59551.1 hypothetical protein SAMN05444006_1219 [Allgaiera indica]
MTAQPQTVALPATQPQTVGLATGVPAEQIAATRRAFPAVRLGYELELQAADPWTGLAAISTALQAAGLRLGLMRCTAEGAIFLRVEETETPDLEGLRQRLAAQGPVELRRWVTVLGVGTASTSGG